MHLGGCPGTRTPYAVAPDLQSGAVTSSARHPKFVKERSQQELLYGLLFISQLLLFVTFSLQTTESLDSLVRRHIPVVLVSLHRLFRIY